MDVGIALPTLGGIRGAVRRIRPYVPETPLIRSYGLSQMLDAEVWLKIETATPIASYKLRGALNHLLATRRRNPMQLAVTSSTGNHGQGVACAASMLNMQASIFLPVNAVEIKKSMIRLLGAEITEVGNDLDESKEHARAYAKRNKAGGCPDHC